MTSLDALSRSYGIEDSALDAKRQEMSTSAGAKLAMLAAMGVEAADEEAALAALKAIEDAEWNHPVPPVLVAYQNVRPTQIPIVKSVGPNTIHWLITFEDGTKRCGESNFSDLPLLEERTSTGRVLQRRALTIPGRLPLGYHKFRIASEPSEMSLIVTPGDCWLPEDAASGCRYWGIAAQLYLLKSAHNWGIGDFSDLKRLIETARDLGADIVGINPLHAMFPYRSELASPYSPSDRNLLNVLNIDVEAIPEFGESPEVQRLCADAHFKSALEEARRSDHVAYESVAMRKLDALRVVFEAFEKNKCLTRHREFEAFISERASLLERACTFQALRSYFASIDPALADSKRWPEEFRNYRSPAVARWAGYNKPLIRFQLWLQWIADQQLRFAAEAARGMAIGLYRDLAVGADPSGAEMWCHSVSLLPSVHIGAPADIWNPAGQDWGLPPFHPKRLRQEGYRPFIELLQSNMRYCGALRIDHAMALQRLYWIPAGGDAKDGAFVQYPLDDLVGILALESHRNRCLVVGEDLGTVPEGFRERMAEAKVLSYRVLIFERNEDGFLSPGEYPYLSLSVASSHDLPTLSGWWRESDLDSKAALDLFPNAQLHHEARVQRTVDREDLLARLKLEKLHGSGAADAESFSQAVSAFLGKTNSMITLLQLDDLTGEVEQVNIPATTEATHPNWRRKQSISLEELPEKSQLLNAANVMQSNRGAAGAGPRQGRRQ
jgi:4-alpha-glucanotransferase